MPAYDQHSAAVPGGRPSTTVDPVAVDQLHGVDAALAQLPHLPVDAQVAVFTDLHQQLTAALAVTAAGADDPPGQRPGSVHRNR